MPWHPMCSLGVGLISSLVDDRHTYLSSTRHRLKTITGRCSTATVHRLLLSNPHRAAVMTMVKLTASFAAAIRLAGRYLLAYPAAEVTGGQLVDDDRRQCRRLPAGWRAPVCWQARRIRISTVDTFSPA